VNGRERQLLRKEWVSDEGVREWVSELEIEPVGQSFDSSLIMTVIIFNRTGIRSRDLLKTAMSLTFL
jgi:hypothetical protein